MLSYSTLGAAGDGVNPSACVQGTPEFDADVCAAFNAPVSPSTTGFIHESGGVVENATGGIPAAPSPVDCPAGTTLFSFPIGADACVPDGPAAAVAAAQGAVPANNTSWWKYALGVLLLGGAGWAAWKYSQRA